MGDGDFGVEAEGVRRSFGDVRALDGVSLSAPYGQVTALVGDNGAGKTTLLLVLATLLAAHGGQARVAGYDVRTQARLAREHLGWMPDAFGVYDRLTVREYLDFFAQAYRLRKPEAGARAMELLSRVSLVEYAAKPLHMLSRGQKQRLGLVRALLHEPSVLLLDEPASGLDPRSRVELRDLLRGLAFAGTAVLVSSHILGELEEIADRVVLVERGRTVGEHTMAELAGARLDGDGRAIWRIKALDPPDQIARLARESPLKIRVKQLAGGLQAGPMTEEEAAGLLAVLIQSGLRVVAFEPVGGGLETAYLAMTEDRR